MMTQRCKVPGQHLSLFDDQLLLKDFWQEIPDEQLNEDADMNRSHISGGSSLLVTKNKTILWGWFEMTFGQGQVEQMVFNGNGQ